MKTVHYSRWNHTNDGIIYESTVAPTEDAAIEKIARYPFETIGIGTTLKECEESTYCRLHDC